MAPPIQNEKFHVLQSRKYFWCAKNVAGYHLGPVARTIRSLLLPKLSLSRKTAFCENVGAKSLTGFWEKFKRHKWLTTVIGIDDAAPVHRIWRCYSELKFCLFISSGSWNPQISLFYIFKLSFIFNPRKHVLAIRRRHPARRARLPERPVHVERGSGEFRRCLSGE